MSTASDHCDACKKPPTECQCIEWEHEVGVPRRTKRQTLAGLIDGDRLVFGKWNELSQTQDVRVERDNGRFRD
jgi:hypothetical protein